MSSQTVRITEIFYSLQGETRTVGLPTVFVRLTGCPLRCVYCDTEYAFHGGTSVTLETVLRQVESYAPQFVTVTGGEPLAQKSCWPLLEALCDRGYQVSLETSGAMDIAEVDARVVRVVDLKTPASGELARNRYENIPLLTTRDQVKFVLCDQADYDWACEQVRKYQLNERCMVLFSCSYEQLPHKQLAEWILRDRLPVRLQVQLHKVLWGETPGK